MNIHFVRLDPIVSHSNSQWIFLFLYRKLTVSKTKLKRTRSKEEAEEPEQATKRLKVSEDDDVENVENIVPGIDDNLAEYLKRKGISNVMDLQKILTSNSQQIEDDHNHNEPPPKSPPKPSPNLQTTNLHKKFLLNLQQIYFPSNLPPIHLQSKYKVKRNINMIHQNISMVSNRVTMDILINQSECDCM